MVEELPIRSKRSRRQVVGDGGPKCPLFSGGGSDDGILTEGGRKSWPNRLKAREGLKSVCVGKGLDAS